MQVHKHFSLATLHLELQSIVITSGTRTRKTCLKQSHLTVRIYHAKVSEQFR
jgi:hypothetical protein